MDCNFIPYALRPPRNPKQSPSRNKKTDVEKTNGNMVGIKKDTKENLKKAKDIPRALRYKAE